MIKHHESQLAWCKDPQILETVNRGITQSHVKRSLLQFISDIEKFFFGTATENDINGLQSTLDDLTTLSDKTEAGHLLGDNRASFDKVS